jgi:hypothetical protein
MLYAYVTSAEKMAEAMIDGLFHGKKSIIEFTFRLDKSCYSKDGEDIGPSIYWKVRYTTREGGSYIKVEWTPSSYREDIEDWQEIADHDSCWRSCWDDIHIYAREKLNVPCEGKVSWFFNCESIRKVE